MAIEIASNFNPGVREPLDARTIVTTYNEMLNIKTTFDGLEVWVTSEQKKYRYNLSKGEWQETYDASTIMTIIDGIVPKGIIMLWSGSADSIPEGWHLCDGTEGTVDLRNRFVVGAGDSYNVGDKGGADSVTLTKDQMPEHSHSASVTGGAHKHTGTTNTDGSHYHEYKKCADITGDPDGATDSQSEIVKGRNYWRGEAVTSNVSGSGTHSHKFTTDSATPSLTVTIGSVGGGAAHENRPPYYALCYIQKIVGESGVITPDLLAQKIAECLAHAKAYTDEKCAEIAEEIAELNSELDTKLDKENPTGSGSLTLGRFPSGDADTYVARFGNGTSETATSNAMSLDYNGNATFTGNVTDGTNNVLSAKANKAYFVELTETEAAALDVTTAADGLYFVFEED